MQFVFVFVFGLDITEDLRPSYRKVINFKLSLLSVLKYHFNSVSIKYLQSFLCLISPYYYYFYIQCSVSIIFFILAHVTNNGFEFPYPSNQPTDKKLLFFFLLLFIIVIQMMNIFSILKAYLLPHLNYIYKEIFYCFCFVPNQQ